MFYEVANFFHGTIALWHGSTILSCPTRWSTDYTMVSRNYRVVQTALVSAVTDARFSVDVLKNISVKKLILDGDGENLAFNTSGGAAVIASMYGIFFGEGDGVSISIMRHIGGHIVDQLSLNVLTRFGLCTEEVEQITERIAYRRKMNMTAIVCAAYALDSRFV